MKIKNLRDKLDIIIKFFPVLLLTLTSTFLTSTIIAHCIVDFEVLAIEILQKYKWVSFYSYVLDKYKKVVFITF